MPGGGVAPPDDGGTGVRAGIKPPACDNFLDWGALGRPSRPEQYKTIRPPTEGLPNKQGDAYLKGPRLWWLPVLLWRPLRLVALVSGQG